jgi:hypothetical protein
VIAIARADVGNLSSEVSVSDFTTHIDLSEKGQVSPVQAKAGAATPAMMVRAIKAERILFIVGLLVVENRRELVITHIAATLPRAIRCLPLR